MQNRKGSECLNPECEHNFPYHKRHEHIVTNDGTYVKFIVEQSKVKEFKDADTW